MMRERIRLAYSAGMVAYMVAVVVGVIVRDWRRERARVREVVRDTKLSLNEQYGKAAQGLAEIVAEREREEHTAEYDRAAWDRDPKVNSDA